MRIRNVRATWLFVSIHPPQGAPKLTRCTPRPYTVRRSVSQPMCYSQNVCRAEQQVASEAEASFAGEKHQSASADLTPRRTTCRLDLLRENVACRPLVIGLSSRSFTPYQIETADRGVSHLTGSIVARTRNVITGPWDVSPDTTTKGIASKSSLAHTHHTGGSARRS
jgi:hypothetical protein